MARAKPQERERVPARTRTGKEPRDAADWSHGTVGLTPHEGGSTGKWTPCKPAIEGGEWTTALGGGPRVVREDGRHREEDDVDLSGGGRRRPLAPPAARARRGAEGAEAGQARAEKLQRLLGRERLENKSVHDDDDDDDGDDDDDTATDDDNAESDDDENGDDNDDDDAGDDYDDDGDDDDDDDDGDDDDDHDDDAAGEKR
eukprot:2172277-Pyramimonas_sp.AAC.1